MSPTPGPEDILRPAGPTKTVPLLLLPIVPGTGMLDPSFERVVLRLGVGVSTSADSKLSSISYVLERLKLIDWLWPWP